MRLPDTTNSAILPSLGSSLLFLFRNNAKSVVPPSG